MTQFRICALIEIVTEDARLDPDKINVDTPQAARAIREAVIASLPGSVDRLIAVLPVDLAQFIMETHEAACRAVGEDDAVMRPPREQ